MRIKTDKKTGVALQFAGPHSPVRVWQNGHVFIYRKQTAPGVIKFNLFPGEYEVEPKPDGFNFIPFIKKTAEFKLPKPEKNFEGFSEAPDVVRNHTIDYTPARTYVKNNLIEITSRMNDYPISVIYFIIGHELGHNLYKTEWKCDLFACHLMAKKGFGLSQCIYAIEDVMKPGPVRTQRLNNLLKAIKKFRYG